MMPSETFPDASTAINHGLNPVRNTMDALHPRALCRDCLSLGRQLGGDPRTIGRRRARNVRLWRFLLAAICTWGWVTVSGLQVRFARAADHPRFFGLGCCLFSFNFLCFYYGGFTVPSGFCRWPSHSRRSSTWSLESLSSVSGRRARVVGADLGVVRLGLLFWPEINGAGSTRARSGTWPLRARNTVFLLGKHDFDFGPTPGRAAALGQCLGDDLRHAPVVSSSI